MIPTPVLEAKDLADKVVKLEIDMNRQYRRNRQVNAIKILRNLVEDFKQAYKKVCELYPEYAYLITDVTKPIKQR
jgi:Ser-tRNA(Ala) deacylase AlaX